MKTHPETSFQLFLRHISFIACILLFFSSWLKAQKYAISADLSFLKQAEDKGFVFRENDQAKQGLLIFKDHGYN
jgi:hypothetical protein